MKNNWQIHFCRWNLWLCCLYLSAKQRLFLLNLLKTLFIETDWSLQKKERKKGGKKNLAVLQFVVVSWGYKLNILRRLFPKVTRILTSAGPTSLLDAINKWNESVLHCQTPPPREDWHEATLQVSEWLWLSWQHAVKHVAVLPSTLLNFFFFNTSNILQICAARRKAHD